MQTRARIIGVAVATAIAVPILAQDASVTAHAELAVRDALGHTTGADGARTGMVIDIDVSELEAKLARDNVRLIDVRTDQEVAQGIIPGAEHIAMDRFDPAELDLSDGREVVLYCRSGRRSNIVGEQLAAFTGEPVMSLEGGVLAWQLADNPLNEPD